MNKIKLITLKVFEEVIIMLGTMFGNYINRNVRHIQEEILDVLGGIGFKTNSIDDFLNVCQNTYILASLLWYNIDSKEIANAILQLVDMEALKTATPDHEAKRRIFLKWMLQNYA